MKMNAQDIDRYLNLQRPWESFAPDKNTEPLVRQLVEILHQLEPQEDDDYHSVFVSAPRPSFRQYYDYQYETPYKDACKNEIDQARKYYREDYPTPQVWFQLGTQHITENRREEFIAFFINQSVLFTINDCNARDEFDGSRLLHWAIEEAKKVVDAVRNGTYTEILDNIPYFYRLGEIKRKDYWKVFPSKKRAFLANYNAAEVEEFRKNFGKDEVHGTALPAMTARTYYEACAVIYRALGRDRDCSPYRMTESPEEKARYSEYRQTPKELYFANADGRDDGLKNVPLDDAEAFEEWKDKKDPYYEFNGSHPWEIITSFSISFSMHLYPTQVKDGYRFVLAGDAAGRAPQTIVAANALVKAGYPVQVLNYDTIINRIDGEDQLEIYPINRRVLGENVISFPSGQKGEKIAKMAVWETYNYIIRGENNNHC